MLASIFEMVRSTRAKKTATFKRIRNSVLHAKLLKNQKRIEKPHLKKGRKRNLDPRTLFLLRCPVRRTFFLLYHEKKKSKSWLDLSENFRVNKNCVKILNSPRFAKVKWQPCSSWFLMIFPRDFLVDILAKGKGRVSGSVIAWHKSVAEWISGNFFWDPLPKKSSKLARTNPVKLKKVIWPSHFKWPKSVKTIFIQVQKVSCENQILSVVSYQIFAQGPDGLQAHYTAS